MSGSHLRFEILSKGMHSFYNSVKAENWIFDSGH